MPTFSYKVGNESGKISTGVIEADTVEQAAAKLKSQGFSILYLSHGQLNLAEIIDKIQNRLGPEIKSLERVMFTSNFAEMLKTGLPIIDAISTFEDQGGSRRARNMFRQIVSEIRAGQLPSVAFSRFPKSFPPLYTHVMASGETTGTLGETMEYLARQLKKEHELTGRVKGSLMYPVVVLIVMIVVMGFITFSVVPKITAFATSLNQELPLPTKILINGNKFLIKYSPIIAIAAIALAVSLGKVLSTPVGKKKLDTLLLKMPILGTLIKRYDLARFCRLLGAFYHYGISLPQAFDTLSVSLSNSAYKFAALSIKENVARGVSLSQAIEKEDSKLFPGIMVRVVRGAEKSAGVDESLWRLAEYYETELENSLKNMTTIIEPILIVILGLSVVSIAVAVIVPIYKISVSFK
jgi:type II secretory pathway component PulF